MLGCLVLAFALPLGSVLTGVAVLAAGAVVWAVRRGAATRR
jgi:APA family basic amino acid/polyamine antiporter